MSLGQAEMFAPIILEDKQMNELRTVENKVLEILKRVPETRFDDMFLFLVFYKTYTCGKVNDMSFQRVLMNYKELGMPCFESIHRARQRVQSCFPELGRKCNDCIFKQTEINVNVNINGGICNGD